jgi:tetratricopeptide (TPR) repeat protein
MGRFFALALALGLAAGVATADPNDAKAKAKAGELVKQAITKSQSGDHGDAIDLYQQAYMLVPQPLLLSNIASEYQKSGRKPEAIKYFCQYLSEDPHGGMVEYATAQVKTMQIELGVQIDEKDVCKPKAKPLEPVLPGVGSGSDTGAGAGSSAGAAGGGSPPGGGAIVDPGHPQPSHTLQYAGYGVAGAGAIVFGVGVYFGFKAKDISDQITNHKITDMWPDGIKQMEADGKSYQDKQVYMMIGGGVLLGAGVVMAVLGRPHAADAEHVSIAPVATPTTMGIAVSGGF